MMSFCMEVALNGVPLHLVSTRTHIWLRSSTLSPGIQLWATNVVAVDVVDIVGERIILANIGTWHDLEKSADYHRSIVKSPDL